MSKKIYVGNLPYDSTEAGVRELFEEHGEVESIAWITDRETGRFRGFAFVEMDDANATAAIDALNDQMFNGRSLRVNEARPRDDNRNRNRNRGGQNRW